MGLEALVDQVHLSVPLWRCLDDHRPFFGVHDLPRSLLFGGRMLRRVLVESLSEEHLLLGWIRRDGPENALELLRRLGLAEILDPGAREDSLHRHVEHAIEGLTNSPAVIPRGCYGLSAFWALRHGRCTPPPPGCTPSRGLAAGCATAQAADLSPSTRKVASRQASFDTACALCRC